MKPWALAIIVLGCVLLYVVATEMRLYLAIIAGYIIMSAGLWFIRHRHDK